jgi:hypothetical protein
MIWYRWRMKLRWPRIFGVSLHAPSESDLLLVPLCGMGGGVLGASIVHLSQGNPAGMYAMAAAGAATGLLASLGANLDAGWRGLTVALGGAGATFVIVYFLVLAGRG